MKVTVPPPTLEQFRAYQAAWVYFNEALFAGSLKPCLLNFSRHAGALGFFSPKRWQKDEAFVHEISLNPDLLRRPPEESMSTLVHEMAHQWQEDEGSPGRPGYHNTEWAYKMLDLGLIPTDTGNPGGKMTGQKLTHIIDPDGEFIKAFRNMPKAALIPWLSGVPAPEEKPKKPRIKKFKYTCPECGTRIWAELEDLDASCDDCGEKFLDPESLKDWKADHRDRD